MPHVPTVPQCPQIELRATWISRLSLHNSFQMSYLGKEQSLIHLDSKSNECACVCVCVLVGITHDTSEGIPYQPHVICILCGFTLQPFLFDLSRAVRVRIGSKTSSWKVNERELLVTNGAGLRKLEATGGQPGDVNSKPAFQLAGFEDDYQ